MSNFWGAVQAYMMLAGFFDNENCNIHVIKISLIMLKK